MSISEAPAKLQEGQRSFFSKPADLPRAIELFRETTKVAPNWSEAFIWLGSALLEDSKFGDAEANFRRAIDLDATDSRAHLHLGRALDRQGRLKEAVRCYRDGLALKPHYGEADARLMLAEVLKRLGRTDEAVREWQTVSQMKPTHPSYKSPIEEAKRALESHRLAS